jgi:hypothetical protein
MRVWPGYLGQVLVDNVTENESEATYPPMCWFIVPLRIVDPTSYEVGDLSSLATFVGWTCWAAKP